MRRKQTTTKKGVTPEVSTVLLIAITIASAGTYYTIQDEVIEDAKQESDLADSAPIEIESCWADKQASYVEVRNEHSTQELDTSSVNLYGNGEIIEIEPHQSRVRPKQSFRLETEEHLENDLMVRAENEQNEAEIFCGSLYPDPISDYVYDPQPIIEGETAEFKEDTEGILESFNWKKDGTSIDTGSSADYTFTETGTHKITLEIEDVIDRTDKETKQIEVEPDISESSYTSDWTEVSDEENTYHNPSEDTGENIIDVHNPVIRWEGLTETTKTTDTSDSGFSYEPQPVEGFVASADFPDSAGDFDRHFIQYIYNADGGLNSEVELEMEARAYDSDGIEQNSDTKTWTVDQGIHGGTGNILNPTSIGDQREGGFGELEIVSIDYDDVDRDNSNFEWGVRVGTVTEQTKSINTLDPAVSSDVSASFNGKLEEGEVTDWNSIKSFDEEENELTHEIYEGNVRYQIEYDYTY